MGGLLTENGQKVQLEVEATCEVVGSALWVHSLGGWEAGEPIFKHQNKRLSPPHKIRQTGGQTRDVAKDNAYRQVAMCLSAPQNHMHGISAPSCSFLS